MNLPTRGPPSTEEYQEMVKLGKPCFSLLFLVGLRASSRWCAVARSAKKGRVYCGTFQTELEAAKAWDR